MNNENIKWLTTVPATDANFISHLHEATDEEIEWSINLMSGKKGNVTRIKALQKELRKRARERSGK